MSTPNLPDSPSASGQPVSPLPPVESAASHRFASSPTAEQVIPLPPTHPEPDEVVREPDPTRPRRGLGLVLAGLVLLLAFLVSSSPVRNSDFWQHLATGRLLAQGRFHFGVDPFASTTGGVYWVHHAWGFDWLLYLLQHAVGGVGLVLIKALLITALAWLMIRVRQPGAGGQFPAFCTALALVAMSPRLLLQPACLSFFLLGLTFWLLWRPHALSELTDTPRTFSRDLLRYAPLLVLFVLWVNLDNWFLLGPFLTALFWLGEHFQALFFQAPAGSPSSARQVPRTPAWLLPASLAVCLLNPYLLHAFTLPPELSPLLGASGLRQDVRFARLFASPWQVGVYFRPAAAINLAEWSYFVLVGLGLASFAFDRGNLCSWRLPVWLGFAVLGAWQLRTVPFFAVVAGPLTALNLQEMTKVQLPRRKVLAVLTTLNVVFLVGLSVLAWPGWLQGFRLEGRRVGWGIEPDPSLQHVAETLARWHREGRLRDSDHAFLFHPDVAHYCAWFCPEEKAFFDHRLPLFPQVAREYEEVCRGLSPALAGPEDAGSEGGSLAAPASAWQQVLRDRGITYLVLYDPDLRRLQGPLTRLARDPTHWPLLHVAGRAVIFGWNNGQEPDGTNHWADLRLNPDRLAYAPRDEEDYWALPPAPGQGPERLARAPRFWTPFWEPARPSPWEADAAAVYLRYFEDTAPLQQRRHWSSSWGRFAAGLAGLPALSSGPLPLSAGLLTRLGQARLFLPGLNDQPPALPLLAVRAARGALAADPENASSYLLLGQAYLVLARLTGEKGTDGVPPPLARLRSIQTVTALEQALLLNPDLESAHQTLATLYSERRFLDAALEHRRAQLRLTARAGPLPQEDADAFARRLSRLEKEVQAQERLVEDRQNQFVIQSQPLASDPLGKARLALKLGLARQALDDVLLSSRELLFGTAGAQLELELLLMLGRAPQARDLMNDPDVQQSRQRLGLIHLPPADRTGRALAYDLPAYEWLRFCQAAATGEYDLADTTLQDLVNRLLAERRQHLDRLRLALPLTLTSELGLGSQPQTFPFQLATRDERERLAEWVERTSSLQTEVADLRALEGLLDLERGLPSAAERHFQQALGLSEPNLGPAASARSLVGAYLARMRAARGRER